MLVYLSCSGKDRVFPSNAAVSQGRTLGRMGEPGSSAARVYWRGKQAAPLQGLLGIAGGPGKRERHSAQAVKSFICFLLRSGGP